MLRLTIREDDWHLMQVMEEMKSALDTAASTKPKETPGSFGAALRLEVCVFIFFLPLLDIKVKTRDRPRQRHADDDDL